MVNKVAVILNMFSTLMEDVIVYNLYCTTIVTIKYGGSILRYVHINKKSSESQF